MKPNTHVCLARCVITVCVCESCVTVCDRERWIAGCAGRGTGRVGEKALSGQRWRLECGESSVSEHTGQAAHVPTRTRRGKVERTPRERDARPKASRARPATPDTRPFDKRAHVDAVAGLESTRLRDDPRPHSSTTPFITTTPQSSRSAAHSRQAPQPPSVDPAPL